MRNKESVFASADNSGVIYAKCINLSSPLNLNQLILSSLITIMPKIIDFSKPLRKKKYFGLIISLKKIYRRPQGVWIRFAGNRLLVFNESFKFMGTRVYGPICREIRTRLLKSRYKRIISYSKMTI